jgi:hypothetical protein
MPKSWLVPSLSNFVCIIVGLLALVSALLAFFGLCLIGLGVAAHFCDKIDRYLKLGK